MTPAVLAQRIQNIKPSPTLAVSAKVKELKSQGIDILDLGVGEPDFDTPDYIKDAAIAAINNGDTKYTAVDGTKALKVAVQNFYKKLNLNYNLDEIIISTGGKQCIFNLALATLNPGDEVIIPAPYWASYPDIVKVADAVPVFIDTTSEALYKITPQQLKEAITPKTKMIIINSPSNPSGQIYSKTELLKLITVLKKHPNILIATDDMYEQVIWTKEPFCNVLMADPELKNRTVILSGVSKAYAMTGWRIGYALGPKEIINSMAKLQSQSTSNPCSIAQAAATAALSSETGFVKMMNKAFKERHDYVVSKLNAMPGIHCPPAEGTFYCFFSINDLLKKTTKVTNDVEFAEFLIKEAKVALVPGAAFGLENHLRLSFATSLENLKIAMERIHDAVLTL